MQVALYAARPSFDARFAIGMAKEHCVSKSPETIATLCVKEVSPQKLVRAMVNEAKARASQADSPGPRLPQPCAGQEARPAEEQVADAPLVQQLTGDKALRAEGHACDAPPPSPKQHGGVVNPSTTQSESEHLLHEPAASSALNGTFAAPAAMDECGGLGSARAAASHASAPADRSAQVLRSDEACQHDTRRQAQQEASACAAQPIGGHAIHDNDQHTMRPAAQVTPAVAPARIATNLTAPSQSAEADGVGQVPSCAAVVVPLLRQRQQCQQQQELQQQQQ